jgi:hypothetical protein
MAENIDEWDSLDITRDLDALMALADIIYTEIKAALLPKDSSKNKVFKNAKSKYEKFYKLFPIPLMAMVYTPNYSLEMFEGYAKSKYSIYRQNVYNVRRTKTKYINGFHLPLQK